MEESPSTRRYLDGALVLGTRFESAAGVAVLTDCLAGGPDEHGRELGADTPHALLQRIRGERGEMTLLAGAERLRRGR